MCRCTTKAGGRPRCVYNGAVLVSTEDTCGGAWRLDGHRLTTGQLADLVKAEATRYNLREAVCRVAEWYEISPEEVEAAHWFETTLKGQSVQVGFALEKVGDALLKELEPIARAAVRFLMWISRLWSRLPRR